MKKVKNKAGGVIFLVLFGGAFLAVGLTVGLVPMVKTIQDWSQMRGWERVPARVQFTDLIVKHSDTTTYRVVARYEYDYQGQRYVGERVGLDAAGSDNIGTWHQDMHAQLRAAQDRGGFMVWVNPANPDESVVDRDIRWGLFVFRVPFALLFTGVGIAVLLGARYTAKKEREAPTMAWWQRERDWRNGRIVSQGRFALWGAWFFAIFWNGLTLPLLFLAWDKARDEPVLAGALALFLIAGLALLWRALRLTLEWSRFKELILVMSPFPAATGAPLAATLDLPTVPPNAGQFRARLTCRRIQRGRKSTDESAVWQQEVQPQVERAGRGVRLVLHFTPPGGLPLSSEPSDDYRVWSIDVIGSLPGVDLDRRFDVPVLRSATSASASVAPPIVASAPTRADLADKPFRIERTGRGTRINYAPARYRTAGLSVLVFGLVCLGVTAFMINEVLTTKFMVVMLAFMALTFLAASAAFVLGGLALLTYGLSVVLGPTEVAIIRRFLGFPFIRRLAPGDITRVDVVIAGSQQKAGSIEVLYGLKARLGDGQSVGIGDGIRGAAVADALVSATAAACGLPPTQAGGAVQARSESPFALGDPATRERWKRWSAILGRLVGLVFLASLAYEFRGLFVQLL